MAKGLAKAANKASLDAAMAALAALSVGFVIMVMPAAVFGALVVTSGLPALVPAAAPPLGDIARIGWALALAAGAFALVWLMLRALGKGSPPAKAAARDAAPAPVAQPEAEAPPGRRNRAFGGMANLEPEAAPEPPAPRLRRADAHPDAPARRPLFAGSDLGEPVADHDETESDAEGWNDADSDEWPAPLPQFIADDMARSVYDSDIHPGHGEAAADDDVTDSEEPAGFVDADPAAPFDEPAAPVADIVPTVEHEPFATDDFAPAPAAFEPAEPFAEEDFMAPPPADPVADEAPFAEQPGVRPRVKKPLDLSAYEPETDESALDDEPATEESIAELMQRLEQGVARRGAGSDAGPTDYAPLQARAPARPGDDDPIDDRLRNALDDLQRRASGTNQP